MWPAWLVAACAIAVYAVWRGADARPAAIVLAGLVLARAIAPLPFDLRMLAGGVLWCGIGGLFIRNFRLPVAGGLIVAAGLCYLAARLAHAPVAVGSIPFLLSDTFGALALCAIAWSAHHGGGMGVADDRSGVLGRGNPGRRLGRLRGLSHLAQEGGRWWRE